MDKNALRQEIGDQIRALAAERDSTTDAAKKAAATEAIAKLQSARRRINIAANDSIGAKVDELVAQLQAVQTSHNLDAGSALVRTIERIKAATSNPR